MRKLAFIFTFVFGSLAFGQATFPIQISAPEPAVSVTMSAEAVTSTIQFIESTIASGTSGAQLTASATSSQTTFLVNSILGVATCMGALIGSELSVITGISGSSSPYTLTVVRAMIGTTAAVHASGAGVTYTAWGDASCYVTGLLALSVQAGMVTRPGPLVTTQQTAITTAQGTISTIVAAGVTHTP